MSERMHQAVLLEASLEALAIRDDGIYVDATFGRGGHSRAILARLGGRGRLIALDRDPEAVREGGRIADPRFCIVHAPFSALASVLDAERAPAVHGVLADLGASSPQFDDPQRGFSFRADGPLDMRMDPTRGETAAEWLARATRAEIREVLRRYGEERFAEQIAAAIVAARAREPLVRTRQLAELVGAAVRTREAGQSPATRTFQALRILVNRELEEVSLMLPQAVARLAPGGRLVQLGQSAGETATFGSPLVRGRQIEILGLALAGQGAERRRELYERLMEHAAAGRLHAGAERLPLERVADAWERQAASPGVKLLVVP